MLAHDAECDASDPSGQPSALEHSHVRDYNSFCNLFGGPVMDETGLLARVTVNPAIFGGKPIIRGRRLAVEHVLGMLASGDSFETLLSAYSWLEIDDIRACLAYAHRLVGHERVEPLLETGT